MSWWLPNAVAKLPSLVHRRGLGAVRVEPKELTPDDLRDVLEARVQESFQMTLADFAVALREGRLDPESPRVAGLAILVSAGPR